jgi:undecaprenyl-diphosphatase
MITYFQAIVLAIIQGVTELFPISSLGHSVLIANLFGWHNLIKQETASESGFLSFLVMLHLATAFALLVFYRKEWVRIIKGFFRSLKTKDVTHDNDAKLAWLLVAATIPAGLTGLIFEHALRTQFAKPFFACIFLIINGVLLIKGDKLVKVAQLHRPRARKQAVAATDEHAMNTTTQMVSDRLTFGRAALIGLAQVGALFAGISRSGVTMLAGLRSGLNHQDAARFSFLLATPIILAAGLYKMHDFVGSNGDGIRGQVAVGGVVAGIAAYLTVRYLDKYFQDRSLRPFGVYCICAGVFMLLLGIWRGAFS